MTGRRIALCLLISQIIVSNSNSYEVRHEERKFPGGFLFGAASGAYQVEGAWNEDGKSESIWDYDTHQIPSLIQDNSTGDIAGDSYHLYKRDVEMLRELGLDFYRFSLAWTRILPTSFPDKINQAGVDYYNNLINELLKYNIQPVITLFHFDMPKKLQDMGGWTNPHSVDWFGDYARVAFQLFGNRVKYWNTMNEPNYICFPGYGLKALAPRLNISGFAEYYCAKYVLLAHARAYHIYNEFRASQKGSIFITLSSTWMEPQSEAYSDAAKEAQVFDLGMYAHAIFSRSGGWPQSLKEKIARKSAEQGFFRSRLPDFNPEEVIYLRGTSDLFGLNHYTTLKVTVNDTILKTFGVPSRDDDIGVYFYTLHEWFCNEQTFISCVPSGFYKVLTYIKEEYNNPPVFVIENGYGDSSSGLNDDCRVKYYREYLSALLDAIETGSNIVGYTAWSLMDGFEWSRGYTVRFGLYQVNFDSPERTRTPRKSAFMYKQLVRARALDVHFEPDASSNMTIDVGH